MSQHVNPDEETWNEFHRVVNMSSRELSEWLRTREATADDEPLPDQAGQPIGQRVLRILRKRKVDVTEDDLEVMHTVIERVHAARRADLEPTAGQQHWRHRLMSLGHDVFKAPPR